MTEAVRIAQDSARRPAPVPPACAVLRLSLTDFRSYGRLRLDLETAPVVLFGPNGAGKTNILEALSLLVPGRGLRRARLADLERRDAAGTGWGVAATIATPKGVVEIGTGRDPRAGTRPEDEDEGEFAARRIVKIDGKPVRGLAALSGVLRAVWLTPEMDGLFRESAAARRRFIDRAVVGFDRSHATRLNTYERTLRERARLLKAGGADPLWLSALEERMAADGVAIAAARLATADKLSGIAGGGFGPFPAARAVMEGAVERDLAAMPALDAESRLHKALGASRADDSLTGGAAHGPHRSDLRVRHMEKDMPAGLCSTGEQKALMIALVLAIGTLQARDFGAAPLMLLDEVAAHLDRERRGALFERIGEIGAQAWLSGTDRTVFDKLEGTARFFRVNGGVTPA